MIEIEGTSMADHESKPAAIARGILAGLPYAIDHRIYAHLEQHIVAALAAERRQHTMHESVLAMIRYERQRQIADEGWTPAHDDRHEDDELARAAATYVLPLALRDRFPYPGSLPEHWPFAKRHYKPTPHDRIRELVKAAALIVAEIERLQRKEQP
jgi:hypothetical protein